MPNVFDPSIRIRPSTRRLRLEREDARLRDAEERALRLVSTSPVRPIRESAGRTLDSVRAGRTALGRVMATVRNPAGQVGLWKYNRITGYWVLQRTCDAETAEQWLAVFVRDEPAEHFVLSRRKPTKPPGQRRRNSDDEVRALERAASLGDPMAVQRLAAMQQRLGLAVVAPEIDEQIVLSSTLAFKPSYEDLGTATRFVYATRATGITPARWEAAKARLIARGILNRAGAAKDRAAARAAYGLSAGSFGEGTLDGIGKSLGVDSMRSSFSKWEAKKAFDAHYAGRKPNPFELGSAVAGGVVGSAAWNYLAQPAIDHLRRRVRRNPTLEFQDLGRADALAWALRSRGCRAEVVHVGGSYEVRTDAPRAVLEPILRRVARNPRKNPNLDVMRDRTRGHEYGYKGLGTHKGHFVQRWDCACGATLLMSRGGKDNVAHNARAEQACDQTAVGVNPPAQRHPSLGALYAALVEAQRMARSGHYREPRIAFGQGLVTRADTRRWDPRTLAARIVDRAFASISEPKVDERGRLACPCPGTHVEDVPWLAQQALNLGLRDLLPRWVGWAGPGIGPRQKLSRASNRQRNSPMVPLLLVGNKPNPGILAKIKQAVAGPPRRRNYAKTDLKLPPSRVKKVMSVEAAMNVKGMAQAIKRYRLFHGCDPENVVVYDDGRPGNDAGFIIGRSPEVTYTDVVPGSNKGEAGGNENVLWVHETSKKTPTYLAHLVGTKNTILIGDMAHNGVLDWLSEKNER